jgi:hypothetical protein
MEDVKALLTGLGVLGIITLILFLLVFVSSVWPWVPNAILITIITALFVTIAYCLGVTIRGDRDDL